MSEILEIYKTRIGHKATYTREKDMPLTLVEEVLREISNSSDKTTPVDEKILNAAPNMAYNLAKGAEQVARIGDPALSLGYTGFIVNVAAVDFGFIQPGTLTMMTRYYDSCSKALEDIKGEILDEAQQRTLSMFHGVLGNIIAGSDHQKFRDLVQRTINAAASEHTTVDIASRLPDAIRLLQKFKPGTVSREDVDKVDNFVEANLKQNDFYAKPLPGVAPHNS